MEFVLLAPLITDDYDQFQPAGVEKSKSRVDRQARPRRDIT